MCILNDKENEMWQICEAEESFANSPSCCCVSVSQLCRWLSVCEKGEREESVHQCRVMHGRDSCCSDSLFEENVTNQKLL